MKKEMQPLDLPLWLPHLQPLNLVELGQSLTLTHHHSGVSQHV